MAKLSKNINNEEEDGKKELPNPDPSKHTRLGKVVGEDKKEEPTVNTSHKPVLLQQDEHKSFTEKAEDPSIQMNVEAVAEWLMRIFGESTIERWMQNPNFQLPYVEEVEDPKTWIMNALKTLLKLEELQLLAQNIEAQYFQPLEDQQKSVDTAKALMERLEQNMETKQAELENLRQQKFQLNKAQKSSIPIRDFIQMVWMKDQEFESILPFVQEAISPPVDGVSEFVVALYRAWDNFKGAWQVVDQLDEVERVQEMDRASRAFLKQMKDLFVPQRRAILEALAGIINQKMKDFVFVSPEESIQIDPKIHNTKGVLGNKIRQGISFVVIRKSSRQTYFFAEVEVE